MELSKKFRKFEDFIAAPDVSGCAKDVHCPPCQPVDPMITFGRGDAIKCLICTRRIAIKDYITKNNLHTLEYLLYKITTRKANQKSSLQDSISWSLNEKLICRYRNKGDSHIWWAETSGKMFPLRSVSDGREEADTRIWTCSHFSTHSCTSPY